MKIGTIGIGSMGAPMAQNLAIGDDTVVAYDLDPTKVDAIVRNNLSRAKSVAMIAETCELIILMTPDDEALRGVIYSDLGILSVASFTGCVVDLSTTSENLAREIGSDFKERGAGYLDGSVIGGGVYKARKGQSPVVVSGDHRLFEKYKYVLERLGTVDYAGAQGNSKIVKICNNLLLGINTASGAEALSIGEAAGLNIDDMLSWLGGSSGDTTAIQVMFRDYIKSKSYPEGVASLKFYDKDMALGCALADQNAFPAHFSNLAREIYATAAQVEGAEAPFPSVLAFYSAMRHYTP